MAFVRSPKFYLLNGAKELIKVLLDTWMDNADNSDNEQLCSEGEFMFK